MSLKTSFLFLLLVFACQEKTSEDIVALIKGLDTAEKQMAFLRTIANNDQEVRRADIAAIEGYGQNSKEHKASTQTMLAVDADNLIKIQEYLNQYGHPTVMTHGERESLVPWLVTYHASGGFGPKMKIFPFLLKGYKSGDLDSSSLVTILEKMHIEKFGNSVEWYRSMTDAEKIELLMTAMDL